MAFLNSFAAVSVSPLTSASVAAIINLLRNAFSRSRRDSKISTASPVMPSYKSAGINFMTSSMGTSYLPSTDFTPCPAHRHLSMNSSLVISSDSTPSSIRPSNEWAKRSAQIGSLCARETPTDVNSHAYRRLIKTIVFVRTIRLGRRGDMALTVSHGFDPDAVLRHISTNSALVRSLTSGLSRRWQSRMF
jgi:hypothetical protein